MGACLGFLASGRGWTWAATARLCSHDRCLPPVATWPELASPPAPLGASPRRLAGMESATRPLLTLAAGVLLIVVALLGQSGAGAACAGTRCGEVQLIQPAPGGHDTPLRRRP